MVQLNLSRKLLVSLSMTVALCLAVAPALGSDETPDRTLGKLHQKVLLGETVLAEYTLITTLDQSSPFVAKYLYQDQGGQRMVILMVTEDRGPNTITVRFPATDEVLTIVQNEDNSSTIALGGAAPILVLAPDVREKTALPETLKGQGAQALDTISADFRAALRDLAAVGSVHSSEFAFVGAYLGGLFYTEFEGKVAHVDGTGPIAGAVRGFDPNVHPPGDFELAFGDEYFQLH